VVCHCAIGETRRNDFHARNVSRDSLLFERILKREPPQDGNNVPFRELEVAACCTAQTTP
jgi:hypothetical protein